jgi:hypothetical protein
MLVIICMQNTPTHTHKQSKKGRGWQCQIMMMTTDLAKSNISELSPYEIDSPKIFLYALFVIGKFK